MKFEKIQKLQNPGRKKMSRAVLPCPLLSGVAMTTDRPDSWVVWHIAGVPLCNAWCPHPSDDADCLVVPINQQNKNDAVNIHCHPFIYLFSFIQFIAALSSTCNRRQHSIC